MHNSSAPTTLCIEERGRSACGTGSIWRLPESVIWKVCEYLDTVTIFNFQCTSTQSMRLLPFDRFSSFDSSKHFTVETNSPYTPHSHLPSTTSRPTTPLLSDLLSTTAACKCNAAKDLLKCVLIDRRWSRIPTRQLSKLHTVLSHASYIRVLPNYYHTSVEDTQHTSPLKSASTTTPPTRSPSIDANCSTAAESASPSTASGSEPAAVNTPSVADPSTPAAAEHFDDTRPNVGVSPDLVNAHTWLRSSSRPAEPNSSTTPERDWSARRTDRDTSGNAIPVGHSNDDAGGEQRAAALSRTETINSNTNSTTNNTVAEPSNCSGTHTGTPLDDSVVAADISELKTLCFNRLCSVLSIAQSASRYLECLSVAGMPTEYSFALDADDKIPELPLRLVREPNADVTEGSSSATTTNVTPSRPRCVCQPSFSSTVHMDEVNSSRVGTDNAIDLNSIRHNATANTAASSTTADSCTSSEDVSRNTNSSGCTNTSTASSANTASSTIDPPSLRAESLQPQGFKMLRRLAFGGSIDCRHIVPLIDFCELPVLSNFRIGNVIVNFADLTPTFGTGKWPTVVLAPQLLTTHPHAVDFCNGYFGECTEPFCSAASTIGSYPGQTTPHLPAIYNGPLDAGLRFEGQGVYASHQYVYEGSFSDGLNSGTGKMQSKDGETYCGNWFRGRRHGRGCVTQPDGRTLDGEWQFDVFQGRGTMTTKEGLTYVGEWQRHTWHGWGSIMVQGRLALFGYFNFGVLDGWVRTIAPDCTYFEDGYCRAGKPISKPRRTITAIGRQYLAAKSQSSASSSSSSELHANEVVGVVCEDIVRSSDCTINKRNKFFPKFVDDQGPSTASQPKSNSVFCSATLLGTAAAISDVEGASSSVNHHGSSELHSGAARCADGRTAEVGDGDAVQCSAVDAVGGTSDERDGGYTSPTTRRVVAMSPVNNNDTAVGAGMEHRPDPVSPVSRVAVELEPVFLVGFLKKAFDATELEKTAARQLCAPRVGSEEYMQFIDEVTQVAVQDILDMPEWLLNGIRQNASITD